MPYNQDEKISIAYAIISTPCGECSHSIVCQFAQRVRGLQESLSKAIGDEFGDLLNVNIGCVQGDAKLVPTGYNTAPGVRDAHAKGAIVPVVTR